MLDKNYQYLENYFQEISHLDHAIEMLGWDEEVMMPENSAKERNNTLGYLAKLKHQRLNDSNLLAITQTLAKDNTALNRWQNANVSLINKQLLHAQVIPDTLVEKQVKANKAALQGWRKYRAENNWSDFLPLLENVINITKEISQIKADHFNLHPYDVLLDLYSPGFTMKDIDPIFNKLKEFLPETIQHILEKQSYQKTIPLSGSYPIDRQKALAKDLMALIGFDFKQGRLDTAIHPFCGGTPRDVRITTRYNIHDVLSNTYAICHETGHAMYEFGLPDDYLNQPVGKALGMTVHESQSLLMETHACKTKSFMPRLSELLSKHFGNRDAFHPQNLYQQVTQVKPSYIRVDADEVTYPLHIVLRYEIEKALFSDEIKVKDIPDIWQQKMKQYLNIDTKNNHKDGEMQDIHWALGDFGYFPSYALGSLLAAQLYSCALTASPNIEKDIEKGQFDTLINWLKENIHQYGSQKSFNQLVIDATGKPLDADAYISHINKRYLS
ncbi:carboxypeptidase M32 [Fangia hongkongensis]|uniref:carboxypeptidase M32 n=1 Tax=Fangia hongkongensis TaxID=270495 RepID=UPI000369FD4D|nr:carboxypeptidase M32 [Fangia hongkongensis]MBK2126155.1 carboxypeptidase M32 [Fangia hongkongensis]